jgi:flagellar motor protein MotB
MFRMRGLAMAVIGGAVVFGTVGCSDPDAMEIAALREEIESLKNQNGEYARRAAAATDDANAARARAAQLQGELDGCLSRLAATPAPQPSPLPKDWEGDKRVAWVNVEEDILFDSGKAALKSEGRNKLQEIRGQIRDKFPTHNVWVVGHTDTDPITKSGWKDNLELSMARGRVVGEALLAMGIPNKDLVIGGQGPWNPRVPNDGKVNKQRNRRVQIIAVAVPQTAAPVDVSMRN